MLSSCIVTQWLWSRTSTWRASHEHLIDPLSEVQILVIDARRWSGDKRFIRDPEHQPPTGEGPLQKTEPLKLWIISLMYTMKNVTLHTGVCILELARSKVQYDTCCYFYSWQIVFLSLFTETRMFTFHHLYKAMEVVRPKPGHHLSHRLSFGTLPYRSSNGYGMIRVVELSQFSSVCGPMNPCAFLGLVGMCFFLLLLCVFF
jgi:hypothetical protein